ncbi:MAG: serine/threonine-protein kinase [Polyangiaceae bacterium]
MSASDVKRVGMWLQGKWFLERLIGRGATASVYVARHRIGRVAAIKILHAHLQTNVELCERFQREALAVNRFDHPAAVPVMDVDVTEDGAPFIVMEFVEGETIAQRMKRGPIPIPELLDLAGQLLDVLAAAHARGIVHRDIKPENLLLDRGTGKLRVLDFGAAKFEGSVLTEKGALIGTAPYMAPEQVRGEAIDARADVFAVGATMFHAITGRPIHLGNTVAEILYQGATSAPPPLASVASVPDELGLVVDSALSFDPEQRYADARAMQVEVRALSQQLSASGREAPRPPAEVGPKEDDDARESAGDTMLTSPGDAKRK